MRLEGSLDAFSLPDIFSLLSMTKKTGGLHLRSSGAHGVVWLRDGMVTGGASDLTRQSLGRRIAGSGDVTDEALAAAVDRVAGDNESGIARALIDAGAVDEGTLHGLVSEHVGDVVFDLLRWPEGAFEFVVDEANHDDVGVSRSVDDVVADARQRLETWASIEERVPSADTVLSVALSPDHDPHLNQSEWALLALVDGRRTVGELVALGGRGEFSVVGTLAELVTRGLLEAGDADGVDELVRRQNLLRRLESAVIEDVEVEPEITSESAVATDPQETLADSEAEQPAPTEQVTEVDNHDAGDDRDDDADGDESEDGVGDVRSINRIPGQGRDLSAVTPQRPEPFIPSRQPDHPEPMVASVGGGSAVAAAAPANAIERDPSVNKSLLLRLIAGVRGL